AEGRHEDCPEVAELGLAEGGTHLPEQQGVEDARLQRQCLSGCLQGVPRPGFGDAGRSSRRGAGRITSHGCWSCRDQGLMWCRASPRGSYRSLSLMWRVISAAIDQIARRATSDSAMLIHRRGNSGDWASWGSWNTAR